MRYAVREAVWLRGLFSEMLGKYQEHLGLKVCVDNQGAKKVASNDRFNERLLPHSEIRSLKSC